MCNELGFLFFSRAAGYAAGHGMIDGWMDETWAQLLRCQGLLLYASRLLCLSNLYNLDAFLLARCGRSLERI